MQGTPVSASYSQSRYPVAVVATTTEANTQFTQGNGLPSSEPADPSLSATYRDNAADTLYTWDSAASVWQSGLIASEGAIAQLPPDTWVDVPLSGLSEIRDFRLFKAGSELVYFATRHSPDGSGNFQVQTLTAHSAVRVEAIGRKIVSV